MTNDVSFLHEHKFPIKERQCTLRCHRFWWENAMAVMFFFFYDNVVAAKVCSRSCNRLPQKYERETRTCERKRGIHHTVLPDVLLSQTQVASGSFDHGHAVEMIMKQ